MFRYFVIEVGQVTNKQIFWRIFDSSMLIIELYLLIFGALLYSGQIWATIFLVLLSVIYGTYTLWLLYRNNPNYITLGYGLSFAAIFIFIPFSLSLNEGYNSFTFLGTIIPIALTFVYIFTQYKVPEIDKFAFIRSRTRAVHFEDAGMVENSYQRKHRMEQTIEEKKDFYAKRILILAIAFPLIVIIVFTVSFI